ncbi:GntR family transcriptional regulator [Stagnihabitans tardus]|uniref:FCD domain-containing protein n=1 Tax=Stagnihabitans tardus TaxID=2699202 RepID=A0AAE4YAH7_9RHOB|nr:FCD domain-containing protein [Stagnihabitans tardus]NBZ86455.1 FCD domain-containing protein [Stagnihabitans tardus]
MTLAEKAYLSLRNDIVRGDLKPGGALKMADLSARYDMGFSPLREALSRLQGERLVISESLRGFRVSELSLAEFEDALRTRLVIETEALRLSLRLGGDDWAAQLVAATYALKLQAERSGGDIWELETRHHAFHRALLSACGSRWMLDFFEQLYMATDRYRLPVLVGGAGGGGRDLVAEHAALADAALARDETLANRLLVQHYEATAATIRARHGA